MPHPTVFCSRFLTRAECLQKTLVFLYRECWNETADASFLNGIHFAPISVAKQATVMFIMRKTGQEGYMYHFGRLVFARVVDSRMVIIAVVVVLEICHNQSTIKSRVHVKCGQSFARQFSQESSRAQRHS
jgi:hypothetical protein